MGAAGRWLAEPLNRVRLGAWSLGALGGAYLLLGGVAAIAAIPNLHAGGCAGMVGVAYGVAALACLLAGAPPVALAIGLHGHRRWAATAGIVVVSALTIIPFALVMLMAGMLILEIAGGRGGELGIMPISSGWLAVQVLVLICLVSARRAIGAGLGAGVRGFEVVQLVEGQPVPTAARLASSAAEASVALPQDGNIRRQNRMLAIGLIVVWVPLLIALIYLAIRAVFYSANGG